MGQINQPELDDKLFGSYPNLKVIAKYSIAIAQLYFVIGSVIALGYVFFVFYEFGFFISLLVPLLWFFFVFIPLVLTYASVEVLTVFLQCENHLREIRNK